MLKFRKYFFSGLAVTLPVVLTVYILIILFKIADGLLNPIFKKMLGIYIPGLGIVASIILILIVGFFTTHFFNKRLYQGIERWFLRLPFVKKVYPSVKQIIKIIFSESKAGFSKVVLVQYPSRDIWAIGLITNEAFQEASKKTNQELVSIFIASTPSPLTGFFVMIAKKDLIYLDITVEDAMKLIISGGVLLPGKKDS